MLTSAYDTRVLDVEVMAQCMTQTFQLDFDCPSRQLLTQDVPVVNSSESCVGVAGWGEQQ